MSQTTLKPEPAGTGARNPVMHLRVTRRMLVVFTALMVGPWILAGAVYVARRTSVAMQAPVEMKAGATTPESSGRVRRGRPGPWGELEYIRIAIEPPTEFIFLDENFPPPQWFFKGFGRDQVLALFAQAGLTGEEQGTLARPEHWQIKPEGCWVFPPVETVLNLSPGARERIYNHLALFPENKAQNTAFSFNPDYLPERLERSGLLDDTINLFKRLLYTHGSMLLFADMKTVLPRLPDRHERIRFVKTLSRKSTVLVNLRITPQTDIDQLVTYWGFDGRAKDLRPLLESLARVPGGASLDVAHLLPPFARRRLYTYPVPSDDPLESRRDCHWTSLNFFAERPDDRYADQAYANKKIERDYYPIAGGARLGDLVFLVAEGGRIVHSAVFVADDIVFTKNGSIHTQPWMLMRMDQLLEYYSAFYPVESPLKIRLYRAKGSATIDGEQ